MNYIFISDIHLGSMFSQYKRIMDIDLTVYDKVFLVGDIVDVWEKDLYYISKRYRKFIDFVNKLNNVVIVKGNHDPSISDLQSMFSNAEVVDSYFVNNMCIMHGHEFSKNPYRKGFGFFLYILFQTIHINLKYYLRIFRNYVLSLFYRDGLILKGERKAVAYGVDNGYDVILTGHTHMPKIVTTNNITYANCGDFVNYLTYITYTDGVLHLKNIEV
jgi:UDP-2,3-diacylglucosamine pyrophosphatase LpxH